ncbi:MAG TPA: hypothetical protein PLG33_01390 [Prolixibacteraceae bacterium]|nr:hypothetical protein [Prolixibacteraceae bacterium]HPR84670.1 hypothetical protein [Prolixibacteraceae bacterium]
MTKKALLIVLLVFLVFGDLAYSFMQYYYTPIDGDLASGVAWNEHIQKIFDDPFGFRMLQTGEKHINPNRVFSHLAQKEYMQRVPLWLQNFTDPITSVYLSCALLKILVHLIFLFTISALISGTTRIFSKSFLLAAILVSPFIQANGYWGHMGINDHATTYVFFFSIPIVLLFAYYSYFLYSGMRDQTRNLKFIDLPIILVASIILPLSGPLNPGIILIVSLIVLSFYLKDFHKNKGDFAITKVALFLKDVPVRVYAFFIPITAISIYSLVLGLYDSNFQESTIPVFERYLKLPLGIYYQITQSLGVPFLLLTIGINLFLIKRNLPNADRQKTQTRWNWIVLFSLLYLLLLPLGGYRPYRPNILRYDTFIPITITLIYFCANSVFILINNLTGRKLSYYGLYLIAIFAIYANSDRIETKKVDFERQCIETLVSSQNQVTKLPATFNVMSWSPITNPEQSRPNAIMLEYWHVTKDQKLYYQSNE